MTVTYGEIVQAAFGVLGLGFGCIFWWLVLDR